MVLTLQVVLSTQQINSRRAFEAVTGTQEAHASVGCSPYDRDNWDGAES